LLSVFGPLRPPTLPGISNPFCEESMDIFWNYTIGFLQGRVFSPFMDPSLTDLCGLLLA